MLLTRKRATRFAAEAFRWLVPYEVHALPPGQLESGLEWLGFRGSHSEARQLIESLYADLDLVMSTPAETLDRRRLK